MRKAKYGIVIPAVTNEEFNILIDVNNKIIIECMKRENSVPIVKIASKEQQREYQTSMVPNMAEGHIFCLCTLNPGFSLV